MKLFELEATIDLDATGFDDGVTDAESKGKTLAEKLGADADSIKKAFDNAFSISIGSLIADGFKQALGAAWDFIEGSVDVASEVEETNNKIDTIFGSMSMQVHKWANTTKSSFGIGASAAKRYAGQIAGILGTDSYGFTTQQIYDMSTSLVELAGDLASFHNMDFDTIWGKMLSGLRGETEAIEDLGIDMRAAAIGQMYGMTGAEFGKLAPKEQMLKRYEYILSNTTLAQGDFAKNSDSYANQLRVFEENITELQASIGEGLLPVMTSLLEFMNGLFGGTKNADETMNDIGTTMATTYAQVELTATSVTNLIDALSKMEKQGVDTEAEQGVWNALLTELQSTLPGVGKLIDDTTGQINGGTDALRAYAKQWQETQREIAIAAALQEAQNEILTKGKQVAEMEMQIALEKVKAGSADASINAIYDSVKNLLDYAEEDNTNRGILTAELAELAASGNAEAIYYANLLSGYDDSQDKIAEYETKLAAAKMELEDLNEKYTVMENRVRQLAEETGTPMPSQGKATTEAETTEPASSAEPDAELTMEDTATEEIITAAEAAITAAEAASEAADAATDQDPIVITINLTLDGIVEKTVELTMAEIARQTRTKFQTN